MHDSVDWSKRSLHHFPNIQMKFPNREHFRAGEEHTSLGRVQLFDMYTSPQSVIQDKVLATNNQDQLCKLTLQFSGTTLLHQDGKDCLLRPGDLALFRAQRPYSLHFEEDQRSLVVQFPQELLQLSHEQVSQITTLPISEDNGLGTVAVPLFKQLAMNLRILQGPYATQIVRSAIEILGTVLFAMTRTYSNLADDSMFFQKVVAFIDDHLQDPHLGPQMIADHYHVSRRHLYSKFSEENLSVSAYIRNQRIFRIREALANPARQHETIQRISSHYGLNDASQVSKLFKQTFGLTPSAYRHTALNL